MSESRVDNACLRSDEHPLGYVVEILINILARLPAKTVVTCKVVAKHFLKLISEPSFHLMHLVLSPKKFKYIIFAYPVRRLIVDRLFVLEDGEISEDDIWLPDFRDGSRPEISCFRNGLVCCVDKSIELNEVEIQIFNPLTEDTVVLPVGTKSAVLPTVGVSFDPVSNEYKAYRFFSDSAERAGNKYKCEVYTARSKAWRTIAEEVNRPDHSVYHPFCPFYASVGGVMYWFVWSDEDPGIPASILSVDMNDNFTEIKLPADQNHLSFLIEFEGCLAVMQMNSPQLFEWDPLENYQPYVVVEMFKLENSVWNLRLRTRMMIDLSNVYSFNSVAALDNEIFFVIQLENENFDYVIFDFVEEIFKFPNNVGAIGHFFPIAFPYAESLLSPSLM